MTAPQAVGGLGRNRPRDAAASRQALLEAARSLFGQKGFAGTTIRAIGERAGIDAALIARYFGSKADLYIAAVVSEVQGYEAPAEFEQLHEIADALFGLTDEQGLGPVTQALIRLDTADEIRAAARAHIERRLVKPIATNIARRGSDRSQLRAEILVAALMGVNLGRALGWFEELKTVPKKELVELIDELLEDEPLRPSGSVPDLEQL